MEFALNYSPQAAELLREGKIAFDRFKCADWPHMIAEASALKPIYVHFPLLAGNNTVKTLNFETLETMATATNTPFINVHLAPEPQHWPAWREGKVTDEQVIGQMIEDVKTLVARFGVGGVIAENIPYQGVEHTWSYIPVIGDPAVIHRVVTEAGCGFLLDLSHARLTARYVGMDERDFIRALPVQQLRELHLTGIQMFNGRLEDHLGMTDADWVMVEWAFEQIASGAWATPRMVSLEYGGIGPFFEQRSESSVIETDVPRLAKMVDALREKTKA